MICINKVSKSFGKFKALDEVSIAIKKGTIHGIIGENGAGKTTLLQCLAGIYKVEDGEILIGDEPVFENDKLKERIGYVADRNQFFRSYRVKDLVSFFKQMYPTFSEEDFNSYNEIFKLNPNNKVRQLSKGMQMRLSFILRLATHPEVMILDEPTSGLDAKIKKHLLDLLIDEVATRQTTVVISSHHLSELERICDQITIVEHGKVLYDASVDELKTNIKKIQIVFDKEAPSELSKWEEALAISQVGNVHYFVTNAYSETLEQKLVQAGAIKLSIIPMELEEIFIHLSDDKVKINDQGEAKENAEI